MSESVIKHYRCEICNKTHSVKLEKIITQGRKKFPFPYVILHDYITGGDLKEVLTILYLDSNLSVRHTEIQEVVDDSLFSKRQVVTMTKALFEENERLRQDVARLTEEINILRKNK